MNPSKGEKPKAKHSEDGLSINCIFPSQSQKQTPGIRFQLQDQTWRLHCGVKRGCSQPSQHHEDERTGESKATRSFSSPTLCVTPESREEVLLEPQEIRHEPSSLLHCAISAEIRLPVKPNPRCPITWLAGSAERRAFCRS